MRSPLSSRKNNRPVLVVSDDAFVFVAWRAVMGFPFVSQLRFDALRRQIWAAGFQVQCMSQFVFLGLQVGERMRRRVDLTWNPFDHLDAGRAKRSYLVRVIGQQTNA